MLSDNTVPRSLVQCGSGSLTDWRHLTSWRRVSPPRVEGVKMGELKYFEVARRHSAAFCGLVGEAEERPAVRSSSPLH